jgi:hypothetical protein
MLLNDKEAVARLNSPKNLMNRFDKIRSAPRKQAMSLFIPATPKKEPTMPQRGMQPLTPSSVEESGDKPSEPNLDNLLDDSDSKIKLGLAHDSALRLLNKSVTMLESNLDNVKPDRLPSVIAAAGKVVESIRKERSEQAKNTNGKDVHYHFYTPELRKVSEYNIIDVTDRSVHDSSSAG